MRTRGACMDSNDKRFGSNSRSRDDRDRTVPPEENYYGRGGYDFDFNSRASYNDPERSGRNYNARTEYERSGYDDGYRDNYGSSRRADNDYSFSDIFSNSGSDPDYDYEPERARQPRRERSHPKNQKRKKNKLSPVITVLAGLLALIILFSVLGFSILGKIGYDEKSPTLTQAQASCSHHLKSRISCSSVLTQDREKAVRQAVPILCCSFRWIRKTTALS